MPRHSSTPPARAPFLVDGGEDLALLGIRLGLRHVTDAHAAQVALPALRERRIVQQVPDLRTCRVGIDDLPRYFTPPGRWLKAAVGPICSDLASNTFRSATLEMRIRRLPRLTAGKRPSRTASYAAFLGIRRSAAASLTVNESGAVSQSNVLSALLTAWPFPYSAGAELHPEKKISPHYNAGLSHAQADASIVARIDVSVNRTESSGAMPRPEHENGAALSIH